MTIQERFEAFHALNPMVYVTLEDMALEWAARWPGRRCSIETFFGALRWNMAMRTEDPSSDFKLNDHYTSRYVRLLIANNPELDEVFETRRLRSA